MLECQICGHKVCEHIDKLVAEQIALMITLRNILETAAKIAGDKLTKQALPEEHVRRVVDMLLREEGMITWMTFDERAAMQLDLDYRDTRIKELEDQVVGLEKKVRSYEVQKDKKAD